MVMIPMIMAVIGVLIVIRERRIIKMINIYIDENDDDEDIDDNDYFI